MRKAPLLFALIAAVAAAGAADAKSSKTGTHAAAKVSDCDRACLDGMVDSYLEAMIARAPATPAWAAVVRYSENSVSMMIGDGVWATITARSPTALRAADPRTGQVVWMGEIEEHGQPGFLALRLKVEGRKITEAEALVRRKNGPPQYGDPTQYSHDPSFGAAVPAKAKLSRDKLVAVANGYLDGLQGKAGAQFAPGCARQDNGVASTTGDTADGGVPGCAAQFKAGVFKPISRVRDRRFPIVDEARGVVIAAGFLDLPAHADKPDPAKGGLAWATTYPYSIDFIAAFKVQTSGVYRIESISGALPYLMPSPWGGAAGR